MKNQKLFFLDIWPVAAWSWMVEACHWKRLQTPLVTCWGRRLELEALSLDIVFSFLMVFPLAFSTINIIWCRPLGSWKQYQQRETLKAPHFSSETFRNIKSVASFFFLLSLTHSREWNNLEYSNCYVLFSSLSVRHLIMMMIHSTSLQGLRPLKPRSRHDSLVNDDITPTWVYFFQHGRRTKSLMTFSTWFHE